MNEIHFSKIYCILCSIASALGADTGEPTAGGITTEIETGSKTYAEDSYRSIQFMNTSSTLTATVNGEALPPLGTVSYSFPRDNITRPAIALVGNADGVRVDYETW